MIDPWSFAQCSEERYEGWLKRLSTQNSWEQIQDVSQYMIDQLDLEFENYKKVIQSPNLCNVIGVDICGVSPLVGIPGFVYGAI